MKQILFVIIATLTCVGFAETREERVLRNEMKLFGGKIADRREQKGYVAIVNDQKQIDEGVLDAAVKAIANTAHVDYKFEVGKFDIKNVAVKGNASLFFIDDPSLPMSLIAPEGKWAVVNVAVLKSEKMPFFKARVSKETYRTMALLLGVGCSKYPTCITQCITKPEQLDNIADISAPVEYGPRYETYLPGYGIKPYKVSTYHRACREGWAPMPTNEYQKAIWDKVHEIPKNPMKIEFDPKKGR